MFVIGVLECKIGENLVRGLRGLVSEIEGSVVCTAGGVVVRESGSNVISLLAN